MCKSQNLGVEVEKNQIQKNIDIANCLCVMQMYLNKFCNFNEIREEDLKAVCRGHWGCSPAINFAMMCIGGDCAFNGATFVLGTGHGGCALVGNAYLNEYLQVDGCDYSKTKAGLNNLIASFGESCGMRSESNPQINNTYYMGGELGYALAYSFGNVMGDNKKIVFCFIGDGECETGCTASSWILNKALKSSENGIVIPIINLNGHKMGGASLLSLLSKDDLKNYFSAFDYNVNFVSSIEEMQKALSSVKEFIKEKSKTNVNNSAKCPLIILEMEKGFTAPKVNGISFAGTTQAHKDPLAKLSKEEKVEYLKEWIKSYNISIDDIINFKKQEFNGEKAVIESSQTDEKSNYNAINLYNIKMADCGEKDSSARVFGDCMSELAKNNDFYLISPDELISNKINKNQLSHIKHFEILNENICQAIMQGLIMQSKNCINYCYEGFMPIIASMLAQYLKQLYEMEKLGKFRAKPLNYFVTSVCWENCYSHQNPEIYLNLFGKEYENVNILFPLDGASLKYCVKDMINSYNCINIACFSKRERVQILNENNNAKLVKDGYIEIGECGEGADVLLIALGDTMADYMLMKKNRLNAIGLKVRCVYIYNLNVIKNETLMKKIIGDIKNVEFYCHSYKSLVAGWLYKLNAEIKIYGYADKSYLTATTMEKVKQNFKN